MRNAAKLLRDLIPTAPLQAGDVTAYADGLATIELPGGGIAQARGQAAVGDRVFFRDAVIEGPAPLLPVEIIVV